MFTSKQLSLLQFPKFERLRGFYINLFSSLFEKLEFPNLSQILDMARYDFYLYCHVLSNAVLYRRLIKDGFNYFLKEIHQLV